MTPLGAPAPVPCWHCGRPVEVTEHAKAARYLYPGDQPHTVLVEDWVRCACGAYQNVRRVNRIDVDPLGDV